MTNKKDAWKPFFVLKSSAGSGKTYALVHHYLRLALMYPKADYYQRILAITFTNAAASEMKERIMERLHEFAQPAALSGSLELFNDLVFQLKISPQELQNRAITVQSHILHHYSQFSVSTIDSFVHRIIRSFARDLHIHPDFGIEMDTSRFLDEVVDTCLNEVGKDTELTSYLEHFVMSSFDDEGEWNIRKGMLEISSQLLKENSKDIFYQLQKLSLSDYQSIRKKLFTRQEQLFSPVADKIETALNELERAGISPKQLFYSGSGSYTFLTRILLGNFEPPGPRLQEAIAKDWVTKKGVYPEVESRATMLTEAALCGIQWIESNELKEYRRIEKILPHVFTTGLLSKLFDVSIRLKEEENFLLINDFHTIVSEIVQQSPAPFIYERAGERYNHLLIDEFQDTSEMQWKNFLPLIENSLAENHFNLLVGDGKQSIYRWRNGNVEQFVQLPKLHDQAPAHLKEKIEHTYEDDNLNTNRRSGKTIIDFNTWLYDQMQAKLPAFQNVYNGHKQTHHRDFNGLVQTEIVNLGKREPNRARILQGIHEAIEACIRDGYSYGDIAILTRKGKSESTLISEYLMEVSEGKIPLMTEDSFLLKNSKSVLLIMACIRYLAKPNESFYQFNLIENICASFPTEFNYEEIISTYSKPTDNPEGKKYLKGKLDFLIKEFLQKYYPQFLTDHHFYSHPFESIQNLIRMFNLPFDMYLESFENQMLQLSHRNGMGFLEIVQWWTENEHKLYVTNTQKQDAIRILTVHKSKGLQFPVVIFPKFGTKIPMQSIWVAAPQVVHPFESGIISFTPGVNNKETDLEEIQNENNKLFLDELNGLYVATTRPEDRLYLFVEVSAGNNSGAHHALIETLLKHGNQEAIITWGTPDKKEFKKEKASVKTTQTLIGTRSKIDLPNLRYKEQTKRQLDNIEHLRVGNAFHACMEKIHTKNHADTICKQYLMQESLSDSDKSILENLLSNALQLPVFDALYNSSAEIRTEIDIRYAANLSVRPDRILFFPDRVEVYDFKTGSVKKDDHENQVRTYMKYLKEVTELPVSGYLAYVQLKELMTVEP
jgi:ATP-dependent exoDNAse (exonuclease V) beta subunit